MPRLIWEVKFEVDGHIKVKSRMSLRQAKGFLDQFYSDIVIQNSRLGITVSVTAYATNAVIAYKVALYFLSNMVDVLCCELDLPLFLYYYDVNARNKKDYTIKRIVEQEQIERCFYKSRDYQQSADLQPLLKSMS
ncbi:hypothetical protein G9F72_018265 [Clostridium estertheticum]|uniref:hypothetical protein n=1 Tax=Clostridium estertheticum TaxID=238834 RepID=UPI0013E902F4|nr:hypothetical protein [Clostridium estertheticum]MBZ9688279.1 hypothetical protein [Clostridium estertheticum]